MPLIPISIMTFISLSQKAHLIIIFNFIIINLQIGIIFVLPSSLIFFVSSTLQVQLYTTTLFRFVVIKILQDEPILSPPSLWTDPTGQRVCVLLLPDLLVVEELFVGQTISVEDVVLPHEEHVEYHGEETQTELGRIPENGTPVICV